MKYFILFISFLLVSFGLSAQNQAVPVPSNKSVVPVAVTVTLVSSTNPNNNSETPTTAIPNIAERELILPAGVTAVAVNNNSNQLKTTQNTPINTAVPNAVILKSVPQTAIAKRVDDNKEVNKTTKQNK